MFRRIAFVFALFGFGLLAAQVWAEEASQSRHGNYNLRSHVVTQDEREYPQTKEDQVESAAQTVPKQLPVQERTLSLKQKIIKPSCAFGCGCGPIKLEKPTAK